MPASLDPYLEPKLPLQSPWLEVTACGFSPHSDLRGLWIYKLESRVSFNYRLKCLAWIGRQQEPQAWSQDLPACPCSLQQGQQDPRFKSSRGGKCTLQVPTLLIPELSLHTSPASVTRVWPGRQETPRKMGQELPFPADRENKEE